MDFDLIEGQQQVTNPYMVPAAQGVSLVDENRHDGDNLMATTGEARAVSEVKAQVLMAKQFPRNASECMDRILKECERPTLAGAAVYSFPRGKEVVTGPSIRLAEVLARNWGSMTFGLEIERKQNDVGIGRSSIRAFAWDLETNTYASRQFELKHWRQTKAGGYPLVDDRDIYELEANMGSRRMRACILQLIPGDVTSTAVDACRRTTSSKISEGMKNPNDRVSYVAATIAVFQKMGISKADLEDYLSSREVDWKADHMLKLKELKNSLDDGVTSLGDVFPHLAAPDKSTTITKEQIVILMDLAKQSGRQGEIADVMKANGIAKYADIPVAKYEEVKALISGMIPQQEAPKVEAPKGAPAKVEAPKADTSKMEAAKLEAARIINTAPEAKPAPAVSQAPVQGKLPWE